MAGSDPSYVLIVSGPPGGGKTTLARRLAQTSPTRAVHLHTDDFYDAIKSGFIQPWLKESHGQNTVVTHAIAAAAVAFAQGGYAVMLDGVVGPWLLPTYRSEAAAAGVPLHYVVLRPDQETARMRARDRSHMPITEYPPGLFEQFADLGSFERYAIDNTAVGLGTLAANVAAGVSDGSFRL
ncbi:MAG: AAA family ATPase [Caulobacterales bacterium]